MLTGMELPSVVATGGVVVRLRREPESSRHDSGPPRKMLGRAGIGLQQGYALTAAADFSDARTSAGRSFHTAASMPGGMSESVAAVPKKSEPSLAGGV